MKKVVFTRLVVCFLCVMAGMASVSCHRIELKEPHSGVYVKFEIQVNPDIISMHEESYPFPAIVRGSMPTAMQVCFYDVVSHELVYETFISSAGDFVDVSAGTYDIVAYSLNNEVTNVTGTSTRAGSYAYTSGPGTVLSLTRSDDGEVRDPLYYPVIYEPDHLYVGRQENVVIPVVPEDSRIVVIDLDVTPLLESYTIQLLNVVGAERIRSASCYVTGQAPQRYLWDKRYPGNLCAVVFEAPVNVEDGTIITAFNTFGRFNQVSAGVYLNLLVDDVNGRKYQWVYDITEQFDNPDNEKHDIVIISAIVIPDKEEGGFNPSVSDWNAEIITVPLT